MHSTGLLRWQQLVTEMTNQRRRSPPLERETLLRLSGSQTAEFRQRGCGPAGLGPAVVVGAQIVAGVQRGRRHFQCL